MVGKNQYKLYNIAGIKFILEQKSNKTKELSKKEIKGGPQKILNFGIMLQLQQLVTT